MTEYMRLESDSIGEMEVPGEAYYGVQALRANENFPMTGNSLHPDRKSTRLNSSHRHTSRMPSSA